MLEVAITAVFLVPAVVVLLVLRSLVDEGLDGFVARLKRQATVRRRSVHYRGLWKAGLVCVSMALLPIAIGIRSDAKTGKAASGSQWAVLALVSAGLVAVGAGFLTLWWFLAGRGVGHDESHRSS